MIIFILSLRASTGCLSRVRKLKAVKDAPRPKDAAALKSFLGLLMFYSRFLLSHSLVLAPLNRLLKSDGQKLKSRH